jgi:hypothetical protein
MNHPSSKMTFCRGRHWYTSVPPDDATMPALAGAITSSGVTMMKAKEHSDA